MRIPELICKASNVRKDPIGHTGSLRILVHQQDETEINNWRDVDLWRRLAKSWQAQDPERRTEEMARGHFQRVCKALGLKEACK